MANRSRRGTFGLSDKKSSLAPFSVNRFSRAHFLSITAQFSFSIKYLWRVKKAFDPSVPVFKIVKPKQVIECRNCSPSPRKVKIAPVMALSKVKVNRHLSVNKCETFANYHVVQILCTQLFLLWEGIISRLLH